MNEFQLFIDGRRQPPEGGAIYETLDPATWPMRAAEKLYFGTLLP